MTPPHYSSRKQFGVSPPRNNPRKEVDVPAPPLTRERPNTKFCARCDRARIIRVRGMCRLCYDVTRNNGTVIDFAPILRPRDEVMHEWDLLRGEGYTKRQAAERLGMTWEAFDRTFHRARRAGDPRAQPALRTVGMVG
jgi:hypothetical protein